MRIGILTFHFSDNYGALLQAYALRKWLRGQGHDVEFVNYHPTYVEDGRFIWRLNPKSIRQNLKALFQLATKVRTRWFYGKAIAEFAVFRSESLGVSSAGRRLQSMTELENCSLPYDFLICGSDQIWNPSGEFGLDPVYFLDFSGNSKIKRISYAASFGTNLLSKEYWPELKRYLCKLDSISVRECEGATFASQLTGRNVACVPDPTFLLTDYSELLEEAEVGSQNTLFCHSLRTSAGVRELSMKLANVMNLELQSGFNPHRRWLPIGEEIVGGPKAWLKALASAKFVVSNSFHATVFAILLHRPFFAVSLPGERAGLSGRIKNLLEALNLSDRLVEHEDSKDVQIGSIDWEAVDKRIQQLREIGANYLLNNLSAAARRA